MTLSCNVSEILAVLVVYELRATLINTFPTYLYCSNCLPNFTQGLQWRRQLWGTGAAGRVPPRLSTRYFRVIMHFRFAQILTVTRLEKLTLCSVERYLVQAVDIDKIVDRFSALATIAALY